MEAPFEWSIPESDYTLDYFQLQNGNSSSAGHRLLIGIAVMGPASALRPCPAQR